NEITALNKKKPSISRLGDGNKLAKVIPSAEVIAPASQGTVSQPTPGELQQTAPELLKTSKGTGGGDVSTSTLSTVTNSPAGKESVKNLASGTSPDGHQNVDGGSTVDGYQTTTTGYGDNTQEDGPLKTPKGNLSIADANGPTTMGVGQDGTAVTPEVSASSAEDEENVEGKNVQEEEVQPQNRDVKAAALNSSLGHLSQGNNSDGGTVRGSGLLSSLLLLLGLWVFAAL
ncbi:mucin-associated surface protein (MASP), putative, partial [Trypanosoma cruzi]